MAPPGPIAPPGRPVPQVGAEMGPGMIAPQPTPNAGPYDYAMMPMLAGMQPMAQGAPTNPGIPPELMQLIMAIRKGQPGGPMAVSPGAQMGQMNPGGPMPAMGGGQLGGQSGGPMPVAPGAQVSGQNQWMSQPGREAQNPYMMSPGPQMPEYQPQPQREQPQPPREWTG